MSVRAPIRVFLLDDHEVVRRGLRDLLDSEPDISVVGEPALQRRRWPADRRSVRTSPCSTYGSPTATAFPSAARCARRCPPWPV